MRKGGKGKQFEETIKRSFEKVPNAEVLRLKDDSRGFKRVKNPCDFIIYHKPFLYTLECKSVHSKTFSIHSNDPEKKYGLISNFQWEQLLKMSVTKGVKSGVIIWFVENDETVYLSIKLLQRLYDAGFKSIHSYPEWLEYVQEPDDWFYIEGKKKRVYYEYDMQKFLDEMEGAK